jgi:histone-lysine N-methyltransferase NSD2
MRHTGQLSRCVRCPTSFHYGDVCVSAGTVQITKADIVCHKHYRPAKNRKKGQGQAKVVNINWCFDCGGGGSLICCELCPMSVHPECQRGGAGEEGDKFYCDNCTDGKMPLYNDLVWVKLGNYRWASCITNDILLLPPMVLSLVFLLLLFLLVHLFLFLS